MELERDDPEGRRIAAAVIRSACGSSAPRPSRGPYTREVSFLTEEDDCQLVQDALRDSPQTHRGPFWCELEALREEIELLRKITETERLQREVLAQQTTLLLACTELLADQVRGVCSDQSDALVAQLVGRRLQTEAEDCLHGLFDVPALLVRVAPVWAVPSSEEEVDAGGRGGRCTHCGIAHAAMGAAVGTDADTAAAQAASTASCALKFIFGSQSAAATWCSFYETETAKDRVVLRKIGDYLSRCARWSSRLRTEDMDPVPSDYVMSARLRRSCGLHVGGRQLMMPLVLGPELFVLIVHSATVAGDVGKAEEEEELLLGGKGRAGGRHLQRMSTGDGAREKKARPMQRCASYAAGEDCRTGDTAVIDSACGASKKEMVLRNRAAKIAKRILERAHRALAAAEPWVSAAARQNNNGCSRN